jgi:mono/diheme cytochrome c family protein
MFGFAACLAALSTASGQTPVERGNYLVNGVLTCGNCHTPRGPGGAFDMTRQLSGGPQTFEEPSFTVKGPNITPDAETGIGRWSEADIRRAITDGVRPNGISLASIMPSSFYKVFTPQDLDAVVAYVRSVPAVSNKVQAPVYRGAQHAAPPPGGEKQMSQADLRDPLKNGFYQFTIAHCAECHTPFVNEHPDYAPRACQNRCAQEFHSLAHNFQYQLPPYALCEFEAVRLCHAPI